MATDRPSDLDDGQLVAAVLGWGVPRLRDLPWRRTRDPWKVLVSEVMLQQTQAARVVDRWTRFVGLYPTADACAAAPLAEVLTEWQGLGYPRRARNLHRCAGLLSARGGFPDTLDELLGLPGVGPYTARAVLVFAFERDEAVVDTNIARVYARLVGERLKPKQVQSLADRLVPAGDAWAWNQCLMDLGAVICRPAPQCDGCPLSLQCAWRRSGDDPAVGSSGVSGRQKRFEGSDRQARGRLLKALTGGTVSMGDVAELMHRDEATAHRLVSSLIDDGLCTRSGNVIHLGSSSA